MVSLLLLLLPLLLLFVILKSWCTSTVNCGETVTCATYVRYDIGCTVTVVHVDFDVDVSPAYVVDEVHVSGGLDV